MDKFTEDAKIQWREVMEYLGQDPNCQGLYPHYIAYLLVKKMKELEIRIELLEHKNAVKWKNEDIIL